MTDKQIIIDGTKCKYAHFDGGNTQRLLCAIDDCFCDCYRENECYYKQLKRKEQECEELKKIIDEAQNSKLDLKSFLVGEAIQNEYEQQLDQLKAELEAYKMEAEEGKEINAELKAENENWQKEYWKLEQGNDFLAETNSRLKQTLTEIKEIAEKCRSSLYGYDQERYPKQILQKISECEVEDE